MDDTSPVSSWDVALARLEDYLLAYPYDRSLPDLDTILAEAEVTRDFIESDDRALKVLHEAIVARPLSSADAVARVRTEIELLTLEVRVLTERLRHPRTTDEEAATASARLARVRRKLNEIRDLI